MLTLPGLLKATFKVLPTIPLIAVISFPIWEDIYAVVGCIYLLVPWAQERNWKDNGPPLDKVSWESVEFHNRRGLLLSAWWVHAPADKGTIILAHGSHSDRRSMLDMTQVLYDSGYSSLLLDLSAYGRSEGRVSSLGLQEGDDIATAASFLKEKGESRVGAFGASLGAVAVIIGAAQTEDIKAVVADSPYADLGMLLEYWGRGRDVIIPPLFRWLVGLDPNEVRPVEAVRRISPRPVMVIGGEGDTNIPASHFKLVYEAANDPKDLWIVPGAPHVGAFAARPEEYISRVTGFFNTHLAR